jgi:hypothetical protein
MNKIEFIKDSELQSANGGENNTIWNFYYSVGVIVKYMAIIGEANIYST